MNKSGLRREHILTGASLSRSIKPTAVALAVAACFSGAALANPVNPTVVHGTATFQQAGNILNITNSANAIINWGSFSISVGELTRFIQPSALSAVLNRVTGQDPSAILGALQSNGRVFLINPNGIVFGAGAQIDVAGLVASTLKMSNEDFLNNRMRFTDGVGAGSVVNQGQITGGSVYLVGNAVTNNGLITSPNGEVVLAAGNSVELVNPGTPNLRVEVVAADNEARNLGSISAEAGRIGIYAGLIKQSGTISADSAVAEGGRIMLKSTRKTTLDAGSLISARGTSGGEILVFSDMTDGLTEVAGTLDASATVGNGGFVETSASKVKIADGTLVKTLGGTEGTAGRWLIDPNDFYISSAYGGDISGATLSMNLAYGGVDIMSAYGGTVGNGDIFVNDTVSWSSANGLSLYAARNIEVNSPISNTGTGEINMYAGGDGYTNSNVVTQGVGDINVNANVSTKGSISLKAGNDIILNGVLLSAGGTSGQYSSLRLEAYGGSIALTNSTVSALGVDGGEGVINFYASNAGGAINTASSVVMASGLGSYANFYANGNVTLGQVSAESYVNITSNNGAIIDGNTGLNVSAPSMYFSGMSGVGTIDNPLETQGTLLDVYSSGGGIGVINSGSLSLSRAYAGGAAAAIGATGNLTVIDGGEGAYSPGGGLTLAANGDLFVARSATATGTLLLNAGGNVEIGGTRSNYGVSAYGGSATTVVAGGGLSVLPGQYGGYSVLGALFSPTAITTGGNVLVNQSQILGSPDVDMKVGGVIDINGTLAYGGKISASSPSTININFTSVTGGFSVNGVAGLVYDPATNTGFFVNGNPASVGNGINII
jgi:filamentous hemagglutinin family protein